MVVPRFLRKPEGTLADDVALHLIRAAVDGRRRRHQRAGRDAAEERIRRGFVQHLLLLRVDRVQHSLRADDLQTDITRETNDVAHQKLRDVRHPGNVAAGRAHGLQPIAVQPADLGQDVQLRELLA